MMRYFTLILFVICAFVCNSQYYTTAAINVIHATKTGREGDLYLDTNNNNYRIGLTNGELGYLTDDQQLDSIILVNDSLKVYLENGNSATVDVTNLKVEGAIVGDIKSGIQAADHKGWYIMDGRALTSLPAKAQTNAGTIGIVGSLPNATNLTMKTKQGAEALLSTGGSATYTLTQANMPNYSLPTATSSNASSSHTHTATVDSAGLHQHTAQGQNISRVLKNFSSSGSNSDSALVEGGTTPFYTDYDGAHTHNAIINTAGAHTHTVSVNTGGSSTPFSLYQPYFVIRRFIYLGQ